LIDIDHVSALIADNSTTELSEYMKQNDLILTDDDRIVHNSESFEEEYAFWDKRQLVRKILLNS
jgi:hypothetical protein